MDYLALAIGVLAGLVQLAGYWQYNEAMTSHKDHDPSATSWFMWAIGGFVELVIFAGLVEKQAEEVTAARSKEILPAVCAIVVIYTFIRIWRRERSLDISRKDWTIIGFDTALVAFYVATKNVYVANLLLIPDMVVSFWPTLRDTWRKPASEHPKPWLTWTVAYGLLTFVVILEWESAWELIYPAGYLVLHGAVWLISSRKGATAAAV